MFYVAVAPPKTLDDDLIKRVASLIRKEVFDTRLLLAGEIPRIVTASPDTGAAVSVAQSLREAGLVAFVCRDSELRDRPATFVAHAARSEEGRVVFRDRRGDEVEVRTADAFLIIRGQRRTARQEKTSTTKLKLNVPATVLTGGIPIMRRVSQKTAKEPFQAEGFVRIFGRKTSDPRVEMFENHVDYAFLGPELTPSAAANFNAVVERLRKLFPAAIFDDGLTGHFKTDIASTGPEEALEINCKLVYLCHLAREQQEMHTVS